MKNKPVKPTKLGMTIQPKKPTPYDDLGDRMEEGQEEQERLMRQGLKRTSGYQQRSEKKIHKVEPGKPGLTKV